MSLGVVENADLLGATQRHRADAFDGEPKLACLVGSNSTNAALEISCRASELDSKKKERVVNAANHIAVEMLQKRANDCRSVGLFEYRDLKGAGKPDLRTKVIASSGLGHVSRGVEAWASDLAEALDARGVRVLLCKGGGRAERPYETVLPCWQRESKRLGRLSDLFAKRFLWRLGLGSNYGIEQTTFTWNLISYLRRTRADILHVQDPITALYVQRARWLGLVQTKVILGHGTEEPFEFQQKITYLQHLAPWHLAQARQAGFSKPTWTAIPNFIDTERFSPGRSKSMRAELGIPSEAFVVLCAAAIKRGHKRIDYLLDEMAQLHRMRPELPVWLVVAGAWEPETDELLQQGQRLLGERVRFLVRFPRARMPELYRAADIFTLCSFKEMLPIALIEAAASGLPCIVNRHPVLEWVIGAGGCSIDMTQTGMLAATLAEIFCDRCAIEKIGRAARRHCVEHFAKDAVVERILKYYEFVSQH